MKEKIKSIISKLNLQDENIKDIHKIMTIIHSGSGVNRDLGILSLKSQYLDVYELICLYLYDFLYDEASYINRLSIDEICEERWFNGMLNEVLNKNGFYLTKDNVLCTLVLGILGIPVESLHINNFNYFGGFGLNKYIEGRTPLVKINSLNLIPFSKYKLLIEYYITYKRRMYGML